jgi:His-Xaa-Ser system radical SAM maturase HxsB
MQVWPLRFRELASDRILVADDAGGYFLSNEDFLERYALDQLSVSDRAFLQCQGHAFEEAGDLSHVGFLSRWSARQHVEGSSAYIILVPTLRCDLKCSYCQVSRAPVTAPGFDWNEETLNQVIAFLDGLSVTEIKIEFQGGEPLLRLDLLQAVTDFARKRFEHVEFVVCTNLQTVNEEALTFLSDSDVFVSTSLDGPDELHTRNRTERQELTEQFHKNLSLLLESFGPGKVSALPTIDLENPPDPEELISVYESYGLTSLFLRPVNYQGFARKAHSGSQNAALWNAYYQRFVRYLIERNHRTGHVVEEFYLSLCLRRVLGPGADGHTDLRNPNIPSEQSILIDFDGQIYPSDEARMLARIRRVDLSIGNVADGVDAEKLALMAPSHINNFDPDCIHCPYQPFCGSDPVDDLSRTGRIDLPRHESWFCQRQISVFDLAIELLYSCDDRDRFSVSRWLGLQSIPVELRPVAP